MLHGSEMNESAKDDVAQVSPIYKTCPNFEDVNKKIETKLVGYRKHLGSLALCVVS